MDSIIGRLLLIAVLIFIISILIGNWHSDFGCCR